MNIFAKFKETAFSVLPVMIVVLLLGLTIAPLHFGTMTRFMIGGLLVIFGLTLFLLGVDIGILPIGERSGAALTAKRSLPLLLGATFLIGFIVTVAEPDVQVLADQVRGVAPGVSKWGLIFMIAVGVGLFVALGILRTILSIPLNILLTLSYTGVFLLAFCAPAIFQGVAFDSGGATTGPMTVPFIMALGVGVAAVRSKSGKKGKIASSGEDSFGLTGIASIGPVLAVIVYGILIHDSASSDPVLASSASHENLGHGIFAFLNLLPSIFKEVLAALAPLAAMAALFQLFLLKMPPMQVVRMVRGFVFSFAGLVIFLCGAQGGFMPAGEALGQVLGAASLQGFFWTSLLVTVGVIFGEICDQADFYSVLYHLNSDLTDNTGDSRISLKLRDICNINIYSLHTIAAPSSSALSTLDWKGLNITLVPFCKRSSELSAKDIIAFMKSDLGSCLACSSQ